MKDFVREFEALQLEGLVHATDDAIEPTVPGMFADSIVALLSRNLPEAHRNGQQVDSFRGNDNEPGHL